MLVTRVHLPVSTWRARERERLMQGRRLLEGQGHWDGLLGTQVPSHGASEGGRGTVPAAPQSRHHPGASQRSHRSVKPAGSRETGTLIINLMSLTV